MNDMIISNRGLTPEEDLRQQFYVLLQQDGWSIDNLLEITATVVEWELWKTYGLTFSQFIELEFDKGGVGWQVDNVKALMKMKHRSEKPGRRYQKTCERMASMRQRVNELLGEELLPIVGHGGARDVQVDIVNLNPGGNNATYTLRRLKRDAPALAERVIRGELSANAAAIEAGFRKRKPQVDMSSPEAVARAILQHMSPDEVARLVALLVGAVRS